jgi:hypothetical protein
MIAPTTPPPTFIAEPAAPTSDGNWLTEFARLVGWELFLAWRRRAMMITLTCLLLVGYLLIVLVQYGVYFSDTSDSRSATYQAQALTFPGALRISASAASSSARIASATICAASRRPRPTPRASESRSVL